MRLLNLFVNRMLLQDRVVFFQLKPLRSVFAVLSGDVPAHSGHPAVLMLGAFQNYLHPVTFLCHNLFRESDQTNILNRERALIPGLLQNCGNTVFVNGFDRFGRQL